MTDEPSETASPRRAFEDLRPRFLDGTDTPRAFLERCLDVVAAREGEVKAFAHLDIDGARRAADAATDRYRAVRPLSPVDGMPVGIKDIYDTADMPTEWGTPFHKGRRPIADAAHVYALRRGGAVVLGKTATSAFAILGEGPTRNPHDLSRTPGATSAGSAAAVACGMVTAATGSHARGSVIRPASYCGVFALKPSFGALNRGGSPSAAKPVDHLGIFARALDDVWRTAYHIGRVAGGDPGHPGLYGPPEPATAKPIRTLALLETAGWAKADADAKAALTAFAEGLAGDGVDLRTRANDAAIAGYEATLAQIPEMWAAMSAYDNRYPMQSYRDRDASLLHPGILKSLERGEAMTPEDYRAALAFRDAARETHAAFAGRIDAFVTLSAPGIAPKFPDVGDAVFNEPSSLLGMPAVSLPLLTLGGMPLGVQLLGYRNGDYALMEAAAWLVHRDTSRTG